jgi:hypothetical protein
MQDIVADQRVAIGREDGRKMTDNLLIPTTAIPKQGKLDSIPRNILKHDAEKILSTLKNLL